VASISVFRPRFSLAWLLFLVALLAIGFAACHATLALRVPWITRAVAGSFVLLVLVACTQGAARRFCLWLFRLAAAGALLGGLAPACSREPILITAEAASIGFFFGVVVGGVLLTIRTLAFMGLPREWPR
jgi:hypothetical protein